MCCDAVGAPGAVAALFRYVRSCGRSGQHLDVLKYSLGTLCNLSAREEGARVVFDARSALNVVIEQLQMYRDKDSVFRRALRLLRLLVGGSDRASEVAASADVFKRLRAIAVLLEQKAEMEERFQGGTEAGGGAARAAVTRARASELQGVLAALESARVKELTSPMVQG